MRFKSGVDLAGCIPEIIQAMFVADRVLRDRGVEAVVTSARDSHDGPLHNCTDGTCRAFDLRLPSRLAFEQVIKRPWVPHKYDLDYSVASQLRGMLGDHFDVVLERHQQDPLEWHIHVEYDPK